MIDSAYCTIDELKASDRLNINDANSDAVLSGIVSAVSRGIDRECSRFFYQTETQTRYFTAREYFSVFIGDTVSIASMYTDSQSGDRSYPYLWSASYYDLWPFDAAQVAEPEPYRFVEVTPLSIYRFPVGIPKGIKITGVFGWASVPAAINQACLLWSERWFKRYKTPLGVSAMTAIGEMSVKAPPPDPDVLDLIQNYRMPAV